MATAAAGNITRTGREKVVGREFNFAECVAGLIACILALLFWNTEVIHGYKHLHISYKLNDSEQTESYINRRISVLQVGNNISAYTLGNAFGNAVNIIVAIPYLAFACGKRNRVYRLNYALGHIGGSVNRLLTSALIIVYSACKYLNIAVASEKDNALVVGCDTLNMLWACVRRHKKVKIKQEEEGEIAGIKALVKIDRFNININGKYFR